jgi:DNA polymerase I-like protein with 3'-5' exonuclease and polymerase domains
MIQQEMEEVYPLRAPLKVEIHTGRNWEEAH